MPQEPLKTYFEYWVESHIWQNAQTGFYTGGIVDNEADALTEAFNVEGGFSFHTRKCETFDEEITLEDGEGYINIDDQWIRLYHRSPLTYINFEQTYSLDEIIAQVEAGELHLSEYSLARFKGKLSAVNFVKELLGDNADTTAIEPAFIIKEEVISYPPEANEEDRIWRRPIELQHGEKVYDSQREQIWPKPPAL